MKLTIALDIDCLMAEPVFDWNRYGLDFHHLHGWQAIIVYFSLLISPRFYIPARWEKFSHGFRRNRFLVDLLDVSPFPSVKIIQEKINFLKKSLTSH